MTVKKHTEYCDSVHGPDRMRGVFGCDICAAYEQGYKDASQPLTNRFKKIIDEVVEEFEKIMGEQ